MVGSGIGAFSNTIAPPEVGINGLSTGSIFTRDGGGIVFWRG